MGGGVAVLALALIVALLPSLLSAQDAAPAAAPLAPSPLPPAPAKIAKPTTVIAPTGCVTKECHASVKAKPVLHGPVNVNACDSCHTLTDAGTHTYELARKPEELCGFCHKVEIAGAAVVHKPLTEGQCLGCHDPHGGTTTMSLRGKTMAELCKTCHDDVRGEKKSVHGPVAAGACEACHLPHTSEKPKLLVEVGRDLCLSCHLEMKDQLKQVKFVHEPVEKDDCSKCHDPHASDHPKMALSDSTTLCSSCHEDVKNAIDNAKFKHSAVTEKDTCTNCHTAHGSDLKSLMRSEPVSLCLKCHAEPVKASDERTVPAVAMIANPELVKHGPVAEGSCAGCHSVHGSDHSRLLAKPYTEAFYTPFALDKFDLCFSCHDKELVAQPKTATLTGFRNGDVNLHFLHVNKTNRGRTCRACHSTHASTNPLHIRESVPYGKWELPINYSQTDQGGSCAPGCHQALAYDRVNPVPPPKPADETAPSGQGVVSNQPAAPTAPTPPPPPPPPPPATP